MKKTGGFRMLLLGPPGGGKGTVGKVLWEQHKVPLIATGDILRKHVQDGTPAGKRAEDVMKKGGLVGLDIMEEILEDKLRPLRSWVLDGFPRSLQQAVSLDSLLHKLEQPPDLIILLQVPERLIMQRLAGRLIHPASGRVYNEHFTPPKVPGKDDQTGEELVRRPDDEPETVAARLELYNRNLRDILDFYNVTGKSEILHSIYALSSPEALKKLNPILGHWLSQDKRN